MSRLTVCLLMATLLPAAAMAQDGEAKTIASRTTFQNLCDTGVALGIATLVQQQRLAPEGLLAKRQQISAASCAQVPVAQIDELMARQGSMSLARNVGGMAAAQAVGLEGADREAYVAAYRDMLKERGQFGLRAQEGHLTHLENTQGGAPRPSTASAPMTDAQRLDERFVQMCVAGAQGAHQVYRLDAVGQVKPPPAEDRLDAACRSLVATAEIRQQWIDSYRTAETRDLSACATGALVSWRALGVEPVPAQEAETQRLCVGYRALPTRDMLTAPSAPR